MRTFAALSLILTVACGGDEENSSEVVGDVDEAEVTPVVEQAPAPAPQPEPLMRQAVLCCSDLSLEPAMRAYLDLGNILREGDSEALSEKVAQLQSAFSVVEDPAESYARVQETVVAMEDSNVAGTRKDYGELSDLLIDYVEHSAAGELDLAVAYSRDSDRHWLQEGVEPRSPYGDGIQSYTWGRRAEVLAADADRDDGIGSAP